jgi:predicted nucleic acid-binding protein
LIIDTNIVSEVIKPRPDERVAAWFADRPPEALYLTAVTEAELLYGVLLMPQGQRRRNTSALIDAVLKTFGKRIVPFDRSAAAAFATIAANRRRLGRSVEMPDLQIAAIARANSMTIATRNVRDFEHCGVDLVNPFEG